MQPRLGNEARHDPGIGRRNNRVIVTSQDQRQLTNLMEPGQAGPAEHLGVHVNTIRYRLRRAEDLLGTDQSSPKELAATVLAAFIWQRFHTAEQAPS